MQVSAGNVGALPAFLLFSVDVLCDECFGSHVIVVLVLVLNNDVWLLLEAFRDG
jgi:hypothetical protein